MNYHTEFHAWIRNFPIFTVVSRGSPTVHALLCLEYLRKALHVKFPSLQPYFPSGTYLVIGEPSECSN